MSLLSELTQVSEIIHEEEESNEIIENPFHSISALVFLGGNSSNRLAHEILMIHTPLDLWLQESYGSSNLFVEVVKSNKTNDEDNSHPNNGDPVYLNDGDCSHAIYDLTQFTKCYYLSFQNFGTC